MNQPTPHSLYGSRTGHLRIAAMTLAILGTCALLIGFVDKPTALFMKQAFSPEVLKSLHFITDLGKADGYIIGGLLAFLIGRALFIWTAPNPIAKFYAAIARAGGFILSSLALSAILIHILKISLGRPRPKLLFAEGDYGFHIFAFDTSLNSFPSGHSQTVWASVIPLVFLFPKLKYWFIAAAIIIASSRVLVTAHFPSDVILGSYIAILCAIYLRYKWFSDLEIPSLKEIRAEQNQGANS
jgi:membrane-associated phospholipid phosphatase